MFKSPRKKKTLNNTNEKQRWKACLNMKYINHSKGFLKIVNSKNDEDADPDYGKVFVLDGVNINKKRNEITDNITITFDDIIRGINYTQKSSDKKRFLTRMFWKIVILSMKILTTKRGLML